MGLVQERLNNRLTVVLRRKLFNPLLGQKKRAAIKKVLANPELQAQLAGKVNGLKNAPKMSGAKAEGDHPFLDWLLANWPAILQFIMQIVALFMPKQTKLKAK